MLMSFEQNVYQLRQEKLRQIEALGQQAYPHKFEFTHAVPQILAEYTDKTAEQLENRRAEVKVAGRTTSIRLQGKAGFAHLQQGGQRLQVYVKLDFVGEKGFALYKLLDLGDHIGVRGYLFRTRTGELTIHAEELIFLSKDLLPLPEKWHGLTDVELRYRQRYVDLIMNQDVREVFVKRSKIVQSIRRFLDARGYVEVETPMMQPIPGGAAARPFKTHHNALDMDLFLRIAPELYLKRLVVGGVERVFEINRNFRKEGISTRHNPEFTMLEWYCAYEDWKYMLDMTERLVRAAAARPTLTYQGKTIDVAKPFARLAITDAIRKQGIPGDLRDRRFLSKKLTELGVEHRSEQGWGALQLMLFEAIAEKHLVDPTFVLDFPAEVSPLARRRDSDPELTDRFELFIDAKEIANGFSELNDPEDQAARFLEQAQRKEAGGPEAMHYDADYIRALDNAMPPPPPPAPPLNPLASFALNRRTYASAL